ncbi:MAG: hypothetical protein LIO87_05800 [Eubacterium sp.]|nr:hypothetical protein [Eubacterium sp.]
MKKRIFFVSHCPHINKKVNFSVDYEYIDFLGDQHTHAIKLGYSCSASSSCTIETSEHCPLFKNAKPPV